MSEIRFLILVFLGNSFCGNAQNYIPYYNLVNEAEYAVYNQDYEKAIRDFEAAFAIEKPHAKDLYLLAFSLSELDSVAHKKKVENLLLRASEKSGLVPVFLRERPLNMDLDPEFLTDLENSSENWLKTTAALNDTMAYFEKRYRELLTVYRDSIYPFYENDEKESIDFKKRMAVHDSIFQVEFLEYVIANGYPGIYSWGSDIAAGFLMNINSSLYLQYEKVIYKELQNGRIQPAYYGRMADEMGCFTNSKSFYGTGDLLSACQPPLDVIKLNRISIGMSPYFTSLRRFLSPREYTLLE